MSCTILTAFDVHTQVEIDITINKVVEIQNSRLISAYALHDMRFRKLAMLLKVWNKNFFPDKRKRLNSYSITLMLLAHMIALEILPPQARLLNWEEPLVVEYEQQGREFNYSSSCNVALREEIPPECARSDVTHSEAEILISFFAFYAFEFDEVELAIDIRKSNPFQPRWRVLQETAQAFERQRDGDTIIQYLNLQRTA